MPGEASVSQCLTCFPNDNSKRIDYVITYKFDDDEVNEEDARVKQEMRDLFFKQLEEEKIETYFIRFKRDRTNHVYALLHCSMDRLFDEAQRTNHQMRLNNVHTYTHP